MNTSKIAAVEGGATVLDHMGAVVMPVTTPTIKRPWGLCYGQMGRTVISNATWFEIFANPRISSPRSKGRGESKQFDTSACLSRQLKALIRQSTGYGQCVHLRRPHLFKRPCAFAQSRSCRIHIVNYQDPAAPNIPRCRHFKRIFHVLEALLPVQASLGICPIPSGQCIETNGQAKCA
jgi:hypothetical protein